MKKINLVYKIFIAVGILPVILFAVWIAPVFAQLGMEHIVSNFAGLFSNPVRLQWLPHTWLVILACLAMYALILLFVLSSRKNYMRGKEHGSAQMGNVQELNRKYCNKKEPDRNKILTQHVSISLDGQTTQRNLNTVVIGGSGAGKSLFYARPNLLQCNTSFIVLDTKGELLRTTGYALKENGYKIKVLDLIDMDKSDCYNPFVYIREDNDILRLASNIYANTTDKKASRGDQFWDDAGKNLLCALMFFLYYEAPEYEQNFSMVLEILREGSISDDVEELSILDQLFERVRDKDPYHVAVKYYDDYRRGAADTLRSVQVTLASRLTKFNLQSISNITYVDEMDLDSIGEEKTAIFAIIPDNDKSYNFIVGMLYTQLFQRLFYLADKKHRGSLPVPVHFLMDEFANVALPDDFETLLSTMRSRGIFVSIILQNLAQLKAMFKDNWESIIGNCDQFLYLGNNEPGTHEYISKMLDKQTIDTNTYGQSKGSHGSFTTNSQNAGRALMTPGEVRLMDNKKALLLIRGENSVIDNKYHVFKHPRISLTPYQGGQVYEHGISSLSPTSMLELDDTAAYQNQNIITQEFLSDNEIEILSEDELEYLLKKEGNTT